VSRDGAAIIFKEVASDVLPVPNHTRHPWARWDAYVYTRNPDALFAEFRQRGVAFAPMLSTRGAAIPCGAIRWDRGCPSTSSIAM
jgi:hypothetical protein